MRLIEHTPKRWAEHLKLGGPIAESIVPLDSKGHMRRWSKMSDRWIVVFTGWLVENGGIGTWRDLEKTDASLYNALRKRNLKGLFSLSDVRGPKRDWKVFTDEELIQHANMFVKRDGVRNKSELGKRDCGLSMALRRRGIIDAVLFEEKNRRWTAMDDEELVEHSRGIIEKNCVKRKGQLDRIDAGLYTVLCRRGLIDSVGLEDNGRIWARMSDEELVGYVNGLFEENGPMSKSELYSYKSGLFSTLRRRGLLDEVSFEVKQRNWSSMSDEELIKYAEEFIGRNSINRRIDLANKDRALAVALSRRGLLGRVFAQIDGEKDRNGIRELTEAMSEFGRDKI